MEQATQNKANWVSRQEIIEEGAVTGYVYTSDKGALKFTSVNGQGQERFLFCLMPSHLPYVMGANIAGIVQSEDYKNIIEANEKHKAQAKLSQQVQKQVQREALKAQAALEALQRLGVDTSKLLNK